MKRLLSVAVSLLILGFIYSQLDIAQIKEILSQCNISLLTIGILLTIPLLYLQSIRFTWIVTLKDHISASESFKLIGLANTLNFILPSKLGDLSKAYFLHKDHHIKKSLSISMILFEKALDAVGLVTVSLFGLVYFGFSDDYPIFTTTMALLTVLTLYIIRSRNVVHLIYNFLNKFCPTFIFARLKPLFFNCLQIQKEVTKKDWALLKFTCLTFLISMGHFFQLWVMYRSILPDFPFSIHLALSPITLAAGLLPLAFSGVGTRDAAIVLTFAAYLSEEAAASLGIIATLIMLALALPGLAFIGTYLRNKSEINQTPPLK
jgi:glycosyltransferase 2 family protein